MFTSIGSRTARAKWFGELPTTRPLLTQLRRAADQTISNNLNTLVSWDTIIRDDVAAFSLSAPTLIIPPYGLSRCAVHIQGAWTNNNSGLRVIAVNYNGNNIRLDYRNAFAESNQVLASDILDFSYGDQFAIGVYQNSGSNKNFAGTAFPATGSFVEFQWFAK